MNALELFTLAPSAYKLDNGNVVYLRRVSAAEKVAWVDHITAETTEERTGAVNLDETCRLLVKAISDKSGKPLFSNVEDVKLIDNVTLDALLTEVLRLNGMGKDADEDVKKKSETTSESSASSVTSSLS